MVSGYNKRISHDSQPPVINLSNISKKMATNNRKLDSELIIVEEEEEEELLNSIITELELTNLVGPDFSLQQSLLTTSSEPKSKWQPLSQLDAIKERNKPIQPPAPLASAPFMLPTVQGLQPQFIESADKENELNKSKIEKFQSNLQVEESKEGNYIGNLLFSCMEMDNCKQKKFDQETKFTVHLCHLRSLP